MSQQDKVAGFIVTMTENGVTNRLTEHYAWYDPEPDDDEGFVHPQKNIDDVRALISAHNWHGPLPQQLYPAEWTPGERVRITGEPIPFDPTGLLPSLNP